jgi:hypothetical protein
LSEEIVIIKSAESTSEIKVVSSNMPVKIEERKK